MAMLQQCSRALFFFRNSTDAFWVVLYVQVTMETTKNLCESSHVTLIHEGSPESQIEQQKKTKQI